MKEKKTILNSRLITIIPFSIGIIAAIAVLIFFPGSFTLIAPILLVVSLAISGIWYLYISRSTNNQKKPPSEKNNNNMKEQNNQAKINDSVEVEIQKLSDFDIAKKWFQQADKVKILDIFEKIFEDITSQNPSTEVQQELFAQEILAMKYLGLTNEAENFIFSAIATPLKQKKVEIPNNIHDINVILQSGVKPVAEKIINKIKEKINNQPQLSNQAIDVTNITSSSPQQASTLTQPNNNGALMQDNCETLDTSQPKRTSIEISLSALTARIRFIP